jgi:hypothetical protein
MKDLHGIADRRQRIAQFLGHGRQEFILRRSASCRMASVRLRSVMSRPIPIWVWSERRIMAQEVSITRPSRVRIRMSLQPPEQACMKLAPCTRYSGWG